MLNILQYKFKIINMNINILSCYIKGYQFKSRNLIVHNCKKVQKLK